MSRFALSRIVRGVLTLLLAVATQFAFAGQICRAVMAGGMPEQNPAQAMPRASDVTQARVADLQPCCAGEAKATSTCFLATAGIKSVVALHAGAVPLLDLASPAQSCSAFPVGDASSAVSPPIGSVGPPLHAYLLFHRFLS